VKGGGLQNDAFEAYYRGLYGGRWDGLRESLCAERPAYAFQQGLTAPYFLDYASVLAARAVRLPDGGNTEDGCGEAPPVVLDACAAPGGKSLVIAANLAPPARLLANELSAERRRRLSTVLDTHLCGETRSRVSVSGFDAAAAGRRTSEHGRFAAVLLDAPCSSEAHVLKDAKALAAWTPARPRFLARRQWALLSSAFLLLAPGGSLVYATCALSAEENDGVARRLLAKYGGAVTLDPPCVTEGEAAELGSIILPDRSGLGPMYIARFFKPRH
jgi:16S rRNA (cytosine1407-C5)-methyltransferase